MKKIIALCVAAATMICSCTSEKTTECNIPKNSVEFAGNAFSSFSLGADVKLMAVPNPDNSSESTLQAVVPVRKETADSFDGLEIELVPLDDNGIRLRDGLVLAGEDLDNLLPVFNAGDNVERIILFSISNTGGSAYMSAKEVSQLLESTKGVRMNFNAVVSATTEPSGAEQTDTERIATGQAATEPAATTKAQEEKAQAAKPTEYPMTLDGLLRKYGIYGMLSQYDRALRNGNKKSAKQIEDRMWDIEKRVRGDKSIPPTLRERFVDYIEDKEDEIEDRY